VTKDEAIELGSVGGALIGLTLKTMTCTDPITTSLPSPFPESGRGASAAASADRRIRPEASPPNGSRRPGPSARLAP
jgi:hypothetical protein